jgi:hypothetical protein
MGPSLQTGQRGLRGTMRKLAIKMAFRPKVLIKRENVAGIGARIRASPALIYEILNFVDVDPRIVVVTGNLPIHQNKHIQRCLLENFPVRLCERYFLDCTKRLFKRGFTKQEVSEGRIALNSSVPDQILPNFIGEFSPTFPPIWITRSWNCAGSRT